MSTQPIKVRIISTMSELSEWADIIRKQGEERIRQDDEFLQRLLDATPAQIASLRTQADDWLLDQLMNARGSHDPRVVEAYQVFKDAVRKEVLRRMDRRRD